MWYPPPLGRAEQRSSAQKLGGGIPTQMDINAITNSIGYQNSVNTSSALCGFTDWRMPTKDELLGIVVDGQDPKINSTWFPNTGSDSYWSSTPTPTGTAAWAVQFYGATPIPSTNSFGRWGTNYVRLVRASN